VRRSADERATANRLGSASAREDVEHGIRRMHADAHFVQWLVTTQVVLADEPEMIVRLSKLLAHPAIVIADRREHARDLAGRGIDLDREESFLQIAQARLLDEPVVRCGLPFGER